MKESRRSPTSLGSPGPKPGRGPGKRSRFLSKVQVWTTTGYFLCGIHREEAHRLCRIGAAEVPEEDRKRDKKYWRVILLRPTTTWAGRPIGLPRFGIHCYQGQRYTYREHVANRYYIVQHKRIHPDDRWAFYLAIRENLRTGRARSGKRDKDDRKNHGRGDS